MSKRYYFRNNQIDFYKWCHLIPRAKNTVCEFPHWNLDKRVSKRTEYDESLLIMKQYKVLCASLNEEYVNYLNKYCISRNTAEWQMYSFVFDEIFHNWQEILFPNGEGRMKQLDVEALATSIKQARVKLGYNIVEISGLLGISPATLRAYESGARKVTLDVYYMLCQIYDMDVFEKKVKKVY